ARWRASALHQSSKAACTAAGVSGRSRLASQSAARISMSSPSAMRSSTSPNGRIGLRWGFDHRLEHAFGAQPDAMADVLLNGVLGYPQALRDLLLRQAVNLAQRQHLPALVRERCDRPRKQVLLLSQIHDLIRALLFASSRYDVRAIDFR